MATSIFPFISFSAVVEINKIFLFINENSLCSVFLDWASGGVARVHFAQHLRVCPLSSLEKSVHLITWGVISTEVT